MTVTPNGCDIRLVIAALTLAALLALVLAAERSLSPNEPAIQRYAPRGGLRSLRIVEFIAENGGGAGVRLRKAGK
jgi:hypothetical protein